MVTKDDIETMRILFGADINELCNQGRWKDAKEMEQIRDRLMDALKEQEPCEDAISRQAVLDALRKMMQPCGDGTSIYDQGNFIHNETLADVYQTVEELPPVTPQPKMGQWIIIDDCEQFIAKCSECGRIEDSRMISKYPYCHCGAKMMEVQEVEE